MSSTLDEGFDKILTKIEEQEPNSAITALQTLTWLYYAQQPLLMTQLLEALEIGDNDRHLGAIENTAANIIDCSLSFVAHDQSTGDVRFIHPSVQRWFDCEPQHAKLLSQSYLANTCLTCLNFDEFDTFIKTKYEIEFERVSDKFYSYAAQFWGDHARVVEESLEIQKRVLTFLRSENKKNFMLLVATNGQFHLYRDGQTVLHVLARNGIGSLCQILLKFDEWYTL